MLYNNNVLNILLENSDAIFQSEEIGDVYHTYSKFSSCKQQPNMSMNDSIIEFTNLNYKMDSHKMKLPDKVLPFKLLDGALVSENQIQMCLTLANDLTYNSMKAALKHIFGNNINTSMNEEYNGNSIIKQEESTMVFE